MKNRINTAYQKHLTLLNIEDIEKLLKAGFKFYQIAENIQKDPTTISKEIRKYKTEHYPSNFNNKNNYCKNKNSCTIMNLCNSNCHSACRHCGKCNSICSQYELDLCEKLLKPPYDIFYFIIRRFIFKLYTKYSIYSRYLNKNLTH